MDGAALISAERFARERSSYWSQLVPRLEPFVRAINLGVARFSPPIASDVTPERRAFVAELAFELLKLHVVDNGERARAKQAQAVDSVRRRIAILGPYPEDQIPDPTRVERREALKLTRKLFGFLRERKPESVEVSPDIPGCGVIDRCAADLLIRRPRPRLGDLPLDDEGPPGDQQRLLHEIKMVERSFRAIDFRQLITYAALMSSQGDAPEIVGLVNPRLGTYFECTMDELAIDAAGVPADELLQQIVFDVSAAEVSL